MATIGAFAVVCDGTGRVLCVRQTYEGRRWGLPGGRLERGESPIACLIREVREETGALVRPTRLVCVSHAPYKSDVVFCFAADVVERGVWAPDEEIAEQGYHAAGDLPEPFSPNDRLRIADAIAGVRDAFRIYAEPGVAVSVPFVTGAKI